MALRKRKHNPRRIRSRRAYTIAEVAKIYGTHPRTVQAWVKAGLPVIDKESRPYLLMGEAVRTFLQEKARRGKCSLGQEEIYCFRCKQARKSLPDFLKVVFTNRKLGQSAYQVVVKGLCVSCLCEMQRYTSNRQIKSIFPDVTFTEGPEGLISSLTPSVNTDIEKEKESCE